MPRGDKSGNPKMKRHRAARIAARLREQGAPRAEANRIATGAMEREYAGVGRAPDARKAAVDEAAHDSRTGQSKTHLTTKAPAVSGARDVSAAGRLGTSKRTTGKTGQSGRPVGGRKPRATTRARTDAEGGGTAAASRQPVPRKSAGYRPPSAHKKSKPNRSTAVKRPSKKRTSRALGPGAAGSSRKSATTGRQSSAKKSSGISRTG